MRIYLKTTPNSKPVPFNYQPSLVGAFHKWVGKNEVHDNLSLYSFSWLKQGEKKGNHLTFDKGALWFISAYNNKLIQKVIDGIKKDSKINWGMKVSEVIIKETPQFSDKEQFFLSSPVLIKRFIEGKDKEKHFLYSDKESSDLMTETMQHKLKEAGLDDKPINIEFDKKYPNPHTKLVNYKGIGNKANICPVIIKGDPEAIAFAWNVGVGNSTGIGFGALK